MGYMFRVLVCVFVLMLAPMIAACTPTKTGQIVNDPKTGTSVKRLAKSNKVNVVAISDMEFGPLDEHQIFAMQTLEDGSQGDVLLVDLGNMVAQKGAVLEVKLVHYEIRDKRDTSPRYVTKTSAIRHVQQVEP